MKPQITRQAPEAGSGPNADDTEVQRKKIAERDWLASDGTVAEKEEDATAARYTFLADGKSFAWSPVTDDPTTRMCAIFGALTLMGNITNTWKVEKGEKPDSPIDAIADRFAFMANESRWIDRAAGGVGAKLDLDVMAEAILLVKIDAGAIDGNDLAAVRTAKAEFRQKLESPDYVKVARKVAAVTAKYAELRGGPAKTVDDL